ncbi:type VI secretion system secreted protein VgrG, partial [Oceanimonas baumannii]
TELGSQELLKAGREIHLSSGHKVVLDAGAELTLKAGGSMIKLDPSGITLLGPNIRMNSGGSPGKGTGAAALPPQKPLPTENIKPGKVPVGASAFAPATSAGHATRKTEIIVDVLGGGEPAAQVRLLKGKTS